jgi:ketosteroid isomerase-like protein
MSSPAAVSAVGVPPAVRDVFQAVDAKDAARFVSYLTPDAVFRYANNPLVTGREGIQEAVAQFFQAVKSLRHVVSDTWAVNDMVFCKGEVSYVRHNDTLAGPFPFMNLFKMRDGLIAEYLIYVDISPLWQQ